MLVNPSTEIYVAPRSRSAEAPVTAKANTATPLSSVTQVLDGMTTKSDPEYKKPSRIIRNLPIHIAAEWGMEAPEAGSAYCSPATFASISKKLGSTSEELVVTVTRVIQVKVTSPVAAESSTTTHEATNEADSLNVTLRQTDDIPDGHALLGDLLEGAESWYRLR